MDERATRTAPVDVDSGATNRPPVPGLVAVHSSRALNVAVVAGSRVGRERLTALGVDDDQVSREHFVVDDTKGGLSITDCGSRNGTFADGVRIDGRSMVESGTVIRAGRTLFVAVEDTSAFERHPTRVEAGVVRGPTTTAIFARAKAMGELAQLLVLGESGAGKEHVARVFHESLGGRAPFVALNCATIQSGIAERLLFGAKRGAYTGAETDADGYIHAADGGTLFLDEVAELDLGVQAKLLRFMETREYFPVGEVRPKTARTRVCFATLRDLKKEVLAGRFREDLYHRVSTPTVEVPSLRRRKDEIPFLIELAARRFAERVSIGMPFVERALLATWPGNVRQLLRTVEAACVTAEAEGRTTLSVTDLPPDVTSAEPQDDQASASPEPTDEEIALAMKVSAGNVSVAARALRIDRSKLRRRLAKRS